MYKELESHRQNWNTKMFFSQNPLFSAKTFYLYLINDMTEISLKVALNTINLTLYQYLIMIVY
jgi:hypothetical protein